MRGLAPSCTRRRVLSENVSDVANGRGLGGLGGNARAGQGQRPCTAKRSLVYRDYTKVANAPLGGSNSGVRHDRSTLDSHEIDQMREP